MYYFINYFQDHIYCKNTVEYIYKLDYLSTNISNSEGIN